jgi:hydrogenase maturation protease
MSGRRTLIVGIGSPHGDDRAGWLVARHVEQTLPGGESETPAEPGWQVDARGGLLEVKQARTPADLLHWLPDVQRLLICDACRGLGRPGQWKWWQWPDAEIGELQWSGLHELSLPAALGVAERLGQLPEDVTLCGLEGAVTSPLADVSPAVQQAAAAVASEILALCGLP